MRRSDRTPFVVRPQKWEDSQVGFRGSNASGRRIVLLPGAFWAHGASKMAILGASFLLCILQRFRVWEGMLPPGACRMSHASARRIVSCRGLCVSSLCSQIPLAPAPTFGAFRFCRPPFAAPWDSVLRIPSLAPTKVAKKQMSCCCLVAMCGWISQSCQRQDDHLAGCRSMWAPGGLAWHWIYVSIFWYGSINCNIVSQLNPTVPQGP